MKDKPAAKKSSEEQLVERLRAHPEMMERFEAILGLTESGEGPIRKADDVEDQLVEEVRRLGKMTMREWAKKAEERTAQEFIQAHPKGRSVKKKP